MRLVRMTGPAPLAGRRLRQRFRRCCPASPSRCHDHTTFCWAGTFSRPSAVAVYDPGEVPVRQPPSTGTRPNQIDPEGPNSPQAYQESSLALTGVAGDTSGFEAFIEDRATLKTAFLKVGDSIARGRIKDISFDHIDYEHGGIVQRVQIGQNLRGQLANVGVPAGPSPSVGVGRSAGAATPTGSSPATGTPPPSSGGNTDDIAARLRRAGQRRAGGDRP